MSCAHKDKDNPMPVPQSDDFCRFQYTEQTWHAFVLLLDFCSKDKCFESVRCVCSIVVQTPSDNVSYTFGRSISVYDQAMSGFTKATRSNYQCLVNTASRQPPRHIRETSPNVPWRRMCRMCNQKIFDFSFWHCLVMTVLPFSPCWNLPG